MRSGLAERDHRLRRLGWMDCYRADGLGSPGPSGIHRRLGSARERHFRAEIAAPLRVAAGGERWFTDHLICEELIGAGARLGVSDSASYRDLGRWSESCAHEEHTAPESEPLGTGI
jgi:hypothetical protein